MVTWFFQDTELCVFKQRKKNVKLISCGVVFTLTFLSNRAHLNFDPLGLTYIPPDADVMAFPCSQSNETSESQTSGKRECFFLWSSVEYIHRLTVCLTDRQADCLLFVSVLFCSILKETEWFVRVCFIIRYPFLFECNGTMWRLCMIAGQRG